MDRIYTRDAWMHRVDWEYSTVFRAPTVRPGERVDLVFDGIDTIATVRLNDRVLGHTANQPDRKNFPHVMVERMAMSFRQRELVVSTHGRGLYVVGVGPVEEYSDSVLTDSIRLFEVAPAYAPFSWLPFQGYYGFTTFQTLSHVMELWLLYFPLGFTMASEGTAIRFDGYVPTNLVQSVVAAGMKAFMDFQGGGGAGGPNGL